MRCEDTCFQTLPTPIPKIIVCLNFISNENPAGFKHSPFFLGLCFKIYHPQPSTLGIVIKKLGLGIETGDGGKKI